MTIYYVRRIMSLAITLLGGAFNFTAPFLFHPWWVAVSLQILTVLFVAAVQIKVWKGME